jgi:hypothetical protein
MAAERQTFMQKYGPSSSRAYCIFAKYTNTQVFKFLTFLKHCYWLVGQKCNTNKNIDNELYDLYCNSNEFQTISSINYGLITPAGSVMP